MLENISNGWWVFQRETAGTYISPSRKKAGSLEALCDPQFALEAEWYSARSGDFDIPERWVQRTVRLCRASIKLLDGPIDSEFNHDIWEYTFQMKCAWPSDITVAANRAIALL